MTKLYPIGTQLITKRLSQAYLADEIGFFIETQISDKEFCQDFMLLLCGFDIDTWRVTVTKKNQKWLSPVPIVGDLVDVDKRYSVPTTIYVSKYDVGLLDNPSAVVKRIIERTYPNGQRAPMIEWDKVILLETEGE